MKLLIIGALCVAVCTATSLLQQSSLYYPTSQLYTYPAYANYAYQPSGYQVAHVASHVAQVATAPVVVQKPGIKYVAAYNPLSSVYYGAYSPYSSYYYPSVGYKPLLIYGGGKRLIQAAPGGQQTGEGGPIQGEARPDKPTRIQQAKDSYQY